MNLDSLICLRPDNFTELSRTPWAGEHLSKYFKKKVLGSACPLKIGESWEFSLDPQMPSIINSIETDLYSYLLQNSQITNNHLPEIMIKLISTCDDLSLQIHPQDDDLNLKEDECGKSECWYILDHDPGAGIYLGFSKQSDTIRLDDILRNKTNEIKKYLNFVPVKKGDFFIIEPGTVHAIGKGVTLLEIQKVLPNKKAKTYRVWDWGRKYNKDGFLDLQNGQARETHLKESLEIINPVIQEGSHFIKKSNPQPNIHLEGKILEFQDTGYSKLFILEFDLGDQVEIALKSDYAVLLPLKGEFCTPNDQISLGYSYLLPTKLSNLGLEALKKASLALIIPSSGSAAFSWH